MTRSDPSTAPSIVPKGGGATAQDPVPSDDNPESKYYSLSDYAEPSQINHNDDTSEFESIAHTPTHKTPHTAPTEVEMTAISSPTTIVKDSESSHLCIVARKVSRMIHTTTHNVNYFTVLSAFTACCKRRTKEPFYLLKDMSTVVSPGEMILVISPPGGGKSSYLKAIGSRLPLSSGTVFYNGVLSSKTKEAGCDIRKRIQYMSQTENMLDLLSVEETLDFAHRLGAVQYNADRIEEILHVLGLSHCRTTLVGSLSGGEKKRLSLGETLLTDCNTVLLDEYTSGLSASDSRKITQSLHRWCKGTNRSIVASIVQPTQEVVRFYDRIVVLAHGMTVFDGTPRELFPYFSSIGYPCPADTPDPYAFILDCISDNSNNVALTMCAQRYLDRQQQQQQQQPQHSDGQPAVSEDGLSLLTRMAASPTTSLQFAEAFQQSHLYSKLMSRVDAVLRGYNIHPITPPDPLVPLSTDPTSEPAPLRAIEPHPTAREIISHDTFNLFGTSYRHSRFALFQAVFVRLWKVSMRNKSILITRVLNAILTGIVFGTMYYQTNHLEMSIFNRVAVTAISIAQFSFFNLVEMPSATNFGLVLYRELRASLYPSWTFVISAFLSSIPRGLVEVMIFAPLIYFLSGFALDVGRFFVYFALSIVGCFFHSILFRFFSTISTDPTIAQAFAAPFTVFGIILSGLFATEYSIPVFLRWLYWVFPYSYFVRAVLINELNSEGYDRPYDATRNMGDALMDHLDLRREPYYIGICVIYAIGLSILVAILHVWYLNIYNFEDHRGSVRVLKPTSCLAPSNLDFHAANDNDVRLLASDRNSVSLYNPQSCQPYASHEHSLETPPSSQQLSYPQQQYPRLSATLSLTYHSRRSGLPATAEVDVENEDPTPTIIPRRLGAHSNGDADEDEGVQSHDTSPYPSQKNTPVSSPAVAGLIPPTITPCESDQSAVSSDGSQTDRLVLPSLHTFSSEVETKPKKPSSRAVTSQSASSMPNRLDGSDGSSVRLGSSGFAGLSNALQIRHSNALSALPFPSVTLSFANVNYSVRVKGTDKQILHDVSAFARPNELVAILGVSGAGKSTLLDVISFRKNSGKSSGVVYFNGVPATPTLMAQFAGYVEQFEYLFPYHTVRESLLFAARLRLPYGTTTDIIHKVVDETLVILDLFDIQEQLIGDHNNSGLSISQLKRINIGLELVSNPSVLFLDEPTTGLDCVAARNIVQVLQRVAQTGRTVIATIHNPSTDVFLLFDRLLLLGAGKVIYFGDLGYRAETLVNYMTAQRGIIPIQQHENPATWLIDQVGKGMMTVDEDAMDKDDLEAYRATLSRAASMQSSNNSQNDRSHLRTTSSTLASGKPIMYKNVHVNELHESYRGSLMSYECNTKIRSFTGYDPALVGLEDVMHPGLPPPVQHSQPPTPSSAASGGSAGSATRADHIVIASEPSASHAGYVGMAGGNMQEEPTNAQSTASSGKEYLREFTPSISPCGFLMRSLSQFYLVFSRHWMAYYRNPAFIYIRLIFVLFMALLFGLLYLNLPLSDVSSLISKMAAIILGAIFSSLIHASTALPVLLVTKDIALHEQHSKMYPIFFWVLSTILVEVFWCLIGMLFTVPSYFMLDLLVDINLVYYMVLSYFNNLAYLAFIVFVAVISPNERVAAVLSGLMYAYLTNFTGISLRVHDMSRFYFFLFSLCPSGYLSESLILSQFENDQSLVNVPVHGLDVKIPINIFILAFTGWQYGRMAECMGYILLIAGVLITVSALLLTFLPKKKR